MNKVGFVSIVGKTNAGKSTLLNLILKRKVSIATKKPQTTRNAIQGIYNDEDSQIIFIDTPGIVRSHQKLDRYMNRQIAHALIDMDALIILIDAGVPFNEEKDSALKNWFEKDVPTFIVFNKIDLTNIYLIQTLKEKYALMFPEATQIEISCKDEFNLEELLQKVKEVLPEGEKYYPENYTSDHPFSFLASEILREKILIGKNGQMIKRIGMESRKELEKFLQQKVNLTTFVRVEEKWRDSDLYLKEFGYSLNEEDE